MLQGSWTEATSLVEQTLDAPGGGAIQRIMALVALGRIRARRGDPETWIALDEALALAIPTGTLQRLAPVYAARAEAAWLDRQPERAVHEARAAYDLALAHGHRWHIGELAYWRWRAGDLQAPPAGAWEPYALQMQGDCRAAADQWADLGCPYEAARALSESDRVNDLREAFAEFDRLGARPAAAHVAHRLRELGTQAIPRGVRPTTRDNPAHLTRREWEVLALVAAGEANAGIAARLYLSPRTVEHHITAILRRLDAGGRADAAAWFTLHGQSGGTSDPI